MPEANVAVAGDKVVRDGIRVLAGRESVFTNFQRLTRRLNDLALALPAAQKTCSEGLFGCPFKIGRAALHGQPKAAVPTFLLLKGVPLFRPSSYNESVMSTVSDAAHETQFASSSITSARVLAALLGVPAALPGESAVTFASQPVR